MYSYMHIVCMKAVPVALRFLGKENVCLKLTHFVNINVHVFLGGCGGAGDAGAILRERPRTVHPQYAIVVIHRMVALTVEYVNLEKLCCTLGYTVWTA